jgi:hypothetical protein
MKLFANITFYVAMLLTRSCLVSGTIHPQQIISAPAPAPTVTAESVSITGAEATALTAGVATQVLGAAIDLTTRQVSGAIDEAVGFPLTITGDNFEAVTTQLENAKLLRGSISGLSDTTGRQGVDIPTFDITGGQEFDSPTFGLGFFP